MKKRNWVKWAAMSDILETVAVVVSLLFVAYSINRNTAIMQSINDNFAYQIQDERVRDIVNSSEMASITVRLRRDEEISEVEKERMLMQHLRELNLWEFSYIRHKQGLYSVGQWDNWNGYYQIGFIAEFPEEWWAEVKDWYRDDFVELVDAAYAKR